MIDKTRKRVLPFLEFQRELQELGYAAERLEQMLHDPTALWPVLDDYPHPDDSDIDAEHWEVTFQLIADSHEALRAAAARAPCVEPVEAWNEDGSELLHREGCGRCDACEARKP